MRALGLLPALALTVVTSLATAVPLAPASAAGAQRYEQRAVAALQSARAAAGVGSADTSSSTAACLDRLAERWARTRPAKVRTARAERRCSVEEVRAIRYVSGRAPSAQVGRLFAHAERHAVLTVEGASVGLGDAPAGRRRSVVVLVGLPAAEGLPGDPRTPGGGTGVRDQIITLTNAERAAADTGLGALARDDKCLMANAQAHAEWLVGHGSLQHQDLGDVLTACLGLTYVGENILYNHDGSAAYAVQQWMDSPGHRENILRPQFNVIGTGVAQDPATGRWYAVQVFGRR